MEATSLASEASQLSPSLAAQFCSLLSVVFISERRFFLRCPGNVAIQEGLLAPLCSVSDVIQRFCSSTKCLAARRSRIINSGASERCGEGELVSGVHTLVAGVVQVYHRLQVAEEEEKERKVEQEVEREDQGEEIARTWMAMEMT